MKKFLVLLVSAALVFSMAAVSMAANVKGDFRYEMIEDETKADGKTTDQSYGWTDLRFTVEGAVSDSVTATGVFQLKKNEKNGGTSTFDTNEYYVTYKQAWGSVKAGSYEYKFTPSRVLLKSAGKHVWDKVDVMIATTFNTPVEGLTADVLYQPYSQKEGDDSAYGLSAAYNTEKWGVKGTFADFGKKNDTDLNAIDAYYNINDTMKVFVLGVDYSGYKGNKGDQYQDGFDTVLGFSWDKIAGTSLFAGVEYAINPRFDGDSAKEFNEYTVNVKYKFNNKVGLEIEHYLAAKDKNKDIFRLRYQF
ncbi:MAG TPA: porin [Bacillota bacterium]|nr:porin [Bacillota bacterium]